MADYKSKITHILHNFRSSNPQDDLSTILIAVHNGLDSFIIKKLREQSKDLSPDAIQELSRKRRILIDSKTLKEADAALFDFEQSVHNLVELKPGELEFAIATHLQSTFREAREIAGKLFPDGVPKKENKKERILPFKPEGGKH